MVNEYVLNELRISLSKCSAVYYKVKKIVCVKSSFILDFKLFRFLSINLKLRVLYPTLNATESV